MAAPKMKYLALATDYDGTIASAGRVDDLTLAALQQAKGRGVRLVLVTGRQLVDLFNTFPHSTLFDRIVAENGAVLYTPATKATRTLAPPPPPLLLDALTRHEVPVSVGHSIIATVQPYEHTVLVAIRDLGLEWHVIFNKGAVMVLPAGVTKATGLSAALQELAIVPGRTVGVGDAENDQPFLRLCGLSVAVANALPSVKEGADLQTDGAAGAGVSELLNLLLTGRLDDWHTNPRITNP